MANGGVSGFEEGFHYGDGVEGEYSKDLEAAEAVEVVEAGQTSLTRPGVGCRQQ